MVYRDVARQTLISAVDREIAKRVRKLRSGMLMSQTCFAEELNISRARLDNIERSRVPLHFGIAERICHRFDVNQRWLAEDKFPEHPYIRVDLTDTVRFATFRSTFSEVYFDWLKPALEEQIQLLAVFPLEEKLDRKRYEKELFALKSMSEQWISRIPSDRFSDFILGLYSAGEQLISEIQNEEDEGDCNRNDEIGG